MHLLIRIPTNQNVNPLIDDLKLNFCDNLFQNLISVSKIIFYLAHTHKKFSVDFSPTLQSKLINLIKIQFDNAATKVGKIYIFFGA